MKVLILGASGFIGFPVAQAFVRAGHIVYGITRSETKARQLAAEEIIPIVGDGNDRSTWLPLVATLDVLVDATGGTDVWTIGPENLNATVDAVKQYRPASAPKLGYIYTSGIWVHGNNRKDILTDTTPITTPVEIVKWRPELEQKVVTNPFVNGVVIRPALLYGHSGSLFASLFQSAFEGYVKWFGPAGGRLSLIHRDDLANIFVLAAEKSSIIRGQILDAANDFTESTDDILQKLVEVSGASGYTYIEPTNLFETATVTSAIIRPYLGRALLGWQPRKAGVVDHLEIYYNAWKASARL
ncbi:NAD(P)-binding protein [Sparassis latifolia]|uniref:NAD(P)-binding protein n=1 Tax=Sparassis crispa TaxID=139825 RepID=A0A401GB80_9APHY|nr:NAD(P)-binding protein [Sparassis crispa]GBE79401.1 NAD(P)-binding protein [Sparassis crispa]